MKKSFLLIVFNLFLGLNFVFSQNLSDNLILYLPFNGDLKDESGQNNLMTNDNATLTFDRLGKTYEAMQFNGSSSSVVTSSSIYVETSNFTVSLWFKTDASGLIFNSSSLQDLTRGWGGNRIYMTDLGYIQCGVWSASDNFGQCIKSSKKYNDDQWHHVVFLQRDTCIALYLDNNLEGYKKISSFWKEGFYWAAGYTYVDSYWPEAPTNCYFKGSIDEIRLYYTALDESAISALYNETVVAPDNTTFSPINSSTSNALVSIHFVDANTGFSVGLNGMILKTTDGGTTWISQTSGTTEDLLASYFVNANTGYVVGANFTILKTTNGGAVWVKYAHYMGNVHHLNSVYFTDANTGYAASSIGAIIKTSDGGNTWTKLESGTKSVLFSIYFTDASNGYAVGTDGINNTVIKTSNAGSSWTKLANGTGQGVLRSVYFTSVNVGYAVGVGNNSQATILKTNDAGASWTAQASGNKGQLWSVYFTSANIGYTVGDGGMVLKTTNGGTTWADISDPKTKGNSLQSIFFINANTGFAVGPNGKILKATNVGD